MTTRTNALPGLIPLALVDFEAEAVAEESLEQAPCIERVLTREEKNGLNSQERAESPRHNNRRYLARG